MSGVVHSFGDGSTVIPHDNSPNVDPPEEARRFNTPFPAGATDAIEAYCLAVGDPLAVVTLHPWFYDETMDEWFAVGSSLGIAVNQLVKVGELPRGVQCFLQVTANAGVKKVGLGYMGDG